MSLFGPDLYINQEALNKASTALSTKSGEMLELKNKIVTSFEQLKLDWNTPAGAAFFDKFENDLLKNLENYSDVFEYMSKNLSDAVLKYDDVFDKAEELTKSDY